MKTSNKKLTKTKLRSIVRTVLHLAAREAKDVVDKKSITSLHKKISDVIISTYNI